MLTTRRLVQSDILNLQYINVQFLHIINVFYIFGNHVILSPESLEYVYHDCVMWDASLIFQRMKEAIRHIETQNIAEFDKALIESFDLLREVRL